jgi:minor extracellular serine protease Vpr
MINRNRTLRAALAMSLLGGLAATSVAAERPDIASIRGMELDRHALQRPSQAAQAEIFVELELPSMAKVMAGNTDKTTQDAHLAAIDAQQATFRAQFSQLKSSQSLNLTETGSARFAINGINFWGDVSAVESLRSMPGVKRVEVLPEFELSLSNSVPWIGADSWQNMIGDGSGVKVGVIDSGVDYTHAALGGAGVDSTFFQIDPNQAPPADVFPNSVVKGGIDLVGGQWDPCNPDPELGVLPPVTDLNPIDYNGHGTHVASTIAGSGVAETNLGVGVAPGAEIYMAKVGGDTGCPSLTNVIPAIEWMLTQGTGDIANRMDVVNMSLGSDWGSSSSAFSAALDSATDFGMIFVVAAGNSGDVEYIMGAPAGADSAISVGASVPGGRTVPVMGVSTDAPDVPENVVVAEGTSPVRLSEVSIDGELVLASPELACNGVDNPDALDGKVALVTRGNCAFADKSASVEAAGAIAMVVANNDNLNPTTRITMGGMADATIPSVMVSFEDGDAIANALRSSTVNVALSADQQVPDSPELDDTMAGFSSRGPGSGGNTFKPDITAPGVGIVAARTASGIAGVALSGTSMATPHIAGVTALLLEQNPDLTTAQVRALLQNASYPSLDTNNVPYPVAKQGVGIVDVERLMENTAHAIPSGLSFGRLTASETESVTREVTVYNTSDAATTFEIEPIFRSRTPGITLQAPQSITVPANSEAQFEVTMTLDAGNTIFVPGPGFIISNMDRFPGIATQNETDGWLLLSDGQQTLSMAMMAVVDPSSAIGVSASADSVTFSNEGNAAGEVGAFTLLAGNGLLRQGQALPTAIKAAGYRTREVPVAPGQTDTFMDFMVATNAPWEGAASVLAFIDMDTSGNGEFDKQIVVADLGALQGGAFTGLVVTALFDLVEGGGVIVDVANIDHNDSSFVTSVPVSSLLADGQTAIAGQIVVDNFVARGAPDAVTFAVDVSQQANFGAYNSFMLGGKRSLEVARGEQPASIWRFRNNVAGSDVQVLN